MEITDAEKRIKAAVDRAMDADKTEATCDIGDLLDVLERLHEARLKLTAAGEE